MPRLYALTLLTPPQVLHTPATAAPGTPAFTYVPAGPSGAVPTATDGATALRRLDLPPSPAGVVPTPTAAAAVADGAAPQAQNGACSPVQPTLMATNNSDK